MCCFLLSVPATGPFYRRPIGDNPPRYSLKPHGVNTLKKIVKCFLMRLGLLDAIEITQGK